jgi:hypothetical protein
MALVTKTDHCRPWSSIPIRVCPEVQVQSLVGVAVVTQLGDGSNTLVWKDCWLNGTCIQDFAPALLGLVPRRLIDSLTVQDALPGFQWMTGLRGALSIRVIAEFLDHCEALECKVLQPGVQDQHFWKFAALGSFSTGSAYRALFQGAVEFGPA